MNIKISMDIKDIQAWIDAIITNYQDMFAYDHIIHHPRTYISLDEGSNKFIHFNKRYILWFSNKRLMLVIDRNNKALFVLPEEPEENIHYLVDFCDYYSNAYEITYYHSI